MRFSILILLIPAFMQVQSGRGLFRLEAIHLDKAKTDQSFMNKSLSFVAVKYNVDSTKANVKEINRNWKNNFYTKYN